MNKPFNFFKFVLLYKHEVTDTKLYAMK